jgi:RHS repeat-associated protein
MWQTPYDSRVIPVVGSSFVSAAILRADGSVKYFRQDGTEYPHFAGSPVETLVVNAGGMVFTAGDDHVETYDTQGRLTSIWDKSGLQRSLLYDANNRLQTVSDARGRTLTFNYVIADDQSWALTMTAPDGLTYLYNFDSYDNLLSVTYPDGGVRQYLYGDADWVNAITGIIDENGHAYESVEYDTVGRAEISYLAPNEANGTIGKNTLVYNGNGTTTATDPLGLQTTLTFSTVNGVRNLASVTTPCQSCGGTTKSTTYDANGYPDITTDFNGTVTDHDYDARGLETQRIEAKTVTGGGTPTEKRTIQTDWDATFRVPSERRTYNFTGALEAKTHWIYNTRGQVTARCEIDPADASGYVCSATTAPGLAAKVRRWAYAYCEQSDVTAGSCPLVGLLKSVDGPRLSGDAGMGGAEDITTYTYYQTDDATCSTGGACPHRHGDLWKTTNALSQVTENVAYDKNGRVTRIKDANGTYTDLVYHTRGWLTHRIVRANATGTPGAGDADMRIDYDAVGNVTQVTQPDGDYLAYTYDDAHRLIKIHDNLNNTIDYCPGGVGSATCLDAAGNRLVEQISDTGGIKRKLSRLYNQLGQLTEQLNASGQVVEQSDGFDAPLDGVPLTDGYDPNGNRALVNDGRTPAITTRQIFDPLNRLKSTIQNYAGTDPDTHDATTGYTYDTRDNLRQVTDPDGLNTVYGYDGLNNLTSLSSPDTGNTIYAYDKAGNRSSQTDNRGTLSTYTYDRLNRLKTVVYPTTSLNVTYAYDEANGTTGCVTSYPVGRLTTMTDGSGSTTYCYDRRGNVTVKKQVTNGVTFTSSYTYTVGDRLASLTYPSGMLVTYGRDTVDRVNFVSYKIGATTTTLVSNATYYPFGPLNVLTFGNGRTLTKTYDQNYAIDKITSSGTGGLTLDFGVDVMGDITSASQTIAPPTPDRTYLYDPLYRLKTVQTGAVPPSPLEAYTYDKTGDRLSAALNGGTAMSYTYTAGTHRLASVGATARTYDANGNTKTGVTTGFTFSYDDKNRFASAVQGLNTYSYQTNGRGERVKKGQSGSSATILEYVYDEGGQLVGEYTNTGVSQAEYIYLDATPIAVVRSGALSYVEADHLGTPRRVITPGTNAVVWNWDLLGSAFGTNVPTGSTTLNLRFPGQYADLETGLYYNYFRDYESNAGRYIESDPLGLGGGISTYTYVDAAPLSLIDLRGLQDSTVTAWCRQYPQACAQQMANAAGAAAAAAGAAATVPRSSQECPSDDCGPDTRLEAFLKALNWAGMSFDNQGQPIPWSQYRSRGGPNYTFVKQNGGANFGYESPGSRAKVLNHPDGHPDQVGEGFPDHHQCPHFHSMNSEGEEAIFRYKRGT